MLRLGYRRGRLGGLRIRIILSDVRHDRILAQRRISRGLQAGCGLAGPG
jgi:hypothetical protein